jgi:predicted amidohydrolase
MLFRVALAQLSPVLFDRQANLAKAEEAIRVAAQQGAHVIIFPELYLSGYSLAARAAELAESRHGAIALRVAQLAQQYQIVVLMGYAELTEAGDAAYDAALLAMPDNRTLTSHRKTHLYQHEKGWFVPGSEILPLASPLGNIGVMICYEAEFPEIARTLTLRGADWLAIPTAVMRPYEHIYEIALRSRALENHRWVITVNRVGREGALEFFGRSAVCNPFGQVVAQAEGVETILFAEIDLRQNAQAQKEGDYLSDRRPELYQ